MKEKIKKVILWKPAAWMVAGGMLLLLALALIPLLRMTLYTAPWYDDYSFGASVKNALSVEYSLKSALKGAYGCAVGMYYAWQGCFSCSFFNSLVPMVWREDLYFIGPAFLILFLSLSVFILVWVLVRDVLGADLMSGITVSAVMSIMAVMLIHTAQQGFYWYVGGMSYVGMHACFLLLAAGWIRLLCGTKRIATALLMLWTMAAALIIGGANYVTALQGAVLAAGLFFLGIFLKNKRAWYLLPSVLIDIGFFLCSVAAPGNSKRSVWFVAVKMGAAEAVANSFVQGFRYAWRFTGWMTLAILVVLLPVLFRILRRTDFSFRFPGLVSLGSFCFYCTGFTPNLYAQGMEGLSRSLNNVKITWQILLFMNLVYWLGWIRGKRKAKGKEFPGLFANGAPFLFYAAMGLVMLLVFSRETNPLGTYSSFGAYYWIHTGEANEFHKEYLARVQTIREGGDQVVVTPYHFRPWFLSMGELTEDPDNEANRTMADWYGKQSVICISEGNG